MHISYIMLFISTDRDLFETCSKTCLVSLFIRSIFRGKKIARAVSQRKIERISRPKNMFCLIMFNHLQSIPASNNIEKNVD